MIHAVRNLVRIGRGTVLSRWIQQGFLPATHDETPRNLMGFKDGTNNPKIATRAAMDADRLGAARTSRRRGCAAAPTSCSAGSGS